MRGVTGALGMAALILFVVIAGRVRGQEPRYRSRSDAATARIVVGAVVALFVVIALGKLLT
jgi:hypothetical protein